jgi:translation initiation factor IF-2
MDLRLLKIAKELNIGLAIAVSTLADVGIKVENKPTTKIKIEYYHFLKSNFEVKY